MQQATAPKIVGPHDGKAGFLGTIGVRFMIEGAEADEHFSLVEHPMSAKVLAAPLHRHTREDEYSFVLEGSVGALLGRRICHSSSRRSFGLSSTSRPPGRSASPCR